ELFGYFVKRIVKSSVYESLRYFPVDLVFCKLHITLKFFYVHIKPRLCELYISNFNVFSHLFKKAFKFVHLIYLIDKVHLKGKILMGGIYGRSLIYLHSVAVLYEKSRQHGRR